MNVKLQWYPVKEGQVDLPLGAQIIEVPFAAHLAWVATNSLWRCSFRSTRYRPNKPGWRVVGSVTAASRSSTDSRSTSPPTTT
jgi:hypothetical protein